MAEEPKVNIRMNNYDPPEMTVKLGAEVEFTNSDDEEHSVTSRADGFDVEIMPGETQTIVFDIPGEFEYYCRYHPTMEGVIVVEEK